MATGTWQDEAPLAPTADEETEARARAEREIEAHLAAVEQATQEATEAARALLAARDVLDLAQQGYAVAHWRLKTALTAFEWDGCPGLPYVVDGRIVERDGPGGDFRVRRCHVID